MTDTEDGFQYVVREGFSEETPLELGCDCEKPPYEDLGVEEAASAREWKQVRS